VNCNKSLVGSKLLIPHNEVNIGYAKSAVRKDMKAIIIAAGMGNRLTPLTNDKPKCLLDVNGKSIMQRQLEVLRQCGINDIVVVRGYKKETIAYPDIRYYENTDYENNNILKSLFYAENELDDEFVFSYSDIIFEKNVLDKLLSGKADISLMIDIDWLAHYQHRYQHPVAEAELVTVENNRVTRIGKEVVKPEEAYGEFIGLARFTKKGAEILRSAYRGAADRYHNRPFQQAASFEKAYLTDMMQELIDIGYTIGNVDISGGWVEIDTPEDLERAKGQFV